MNFFISLYLRVFFILYINISALSFTLFAYHDLLIYKVFLFPNCQSLSPIATHRLCSPVITSIFLNKLSNQHFITVCNNFFTIFFLLSLNALPLLGFVSRNCTEEGWSELNPHYEDTTYFSNFKQLYTAGYATSLISLITAIFVFTAFRKFHCTRNYIHINLFFSFILRASAVFIKDLVLFNDENMDHCFMSTVSVSAVAFFQFSILANYFWLLVEGMYLQTLLALTFVFQKKYFWWYILIGWGLPTIIITAWILSRNFYNNKGCWDDTDVAFIWWIIKGPITASLLVNFIIFLNVIRILVQKLTTPGVSGNDTSHFKRLAKSTLLLIPLFGMHYMVFAFLPEHTGAEARLFIELGLGSFQGFVVALLYCFLNGEVSKRFWKWQTQSYLSYSKRRRTLLNESSTVTQTSVLDKSSPLEQQGSEGTALTPNNASLV
uniref:Growth hormone releasing hormone receptor b n=1 Tax=Cyprinodon variegatus TaxID=28743 RepID=A0A3Q2G843_CYPVA